MMRLLLVAVTGLLTIAPNGAAKDGNKKSPAVGFTKAESDEPNRVFFARGVIVAVDEKTNSFELRTSDGIVRARNPESVQFLDRFGATLTGMTLSKAKEQVYHVIVLTDSTVSTGGFKFFFTVEALP